MEPPSASVSPSSEAESSRDIRVWLVEDEAPYRGTLAFLIDHTTGLRCTHQFEQGEAALELLKAAGTSERPDVVLMDVNLPGMGGIASTSGMKAQRPDLPIVMLTIRDDAETIFEAFRAGASGYLVKDAPVDQIVEAVRQAYAGGMLMPPPVARRVLAFLSGPSTQPSIYGLTEREREVLRKMVEGYSQKEIALKLFVSPSTVNTHIQHIYEKLHVHSSSAAVAKALRERLI